ncbi:effector-associated constant component EACC1 [Streptomyces albogriseolus]|uniref:effector-associated constant component EACC1 n=1 Tax=Streptomyces albogriseolus TaxID=1887 RepID=UPI003CF534E0
MNFRILADGDEEALADLQSWLADDPSTSRTRVSAVGGHGPTMGVLEALDVVLSSATDIANFALTYATWRSVKRDESSGAARNGGGGAQRLVHGNSTVDIGHLSTEELADLLRRMNDTRPEERTNDFE